MPGSRHVGVPLARSARILTRLRVRRVVGPSMEPTLWDGDILLTLTGSDVAAGDVVLVELPGGRGAGVKRLAHREPDGSLWLERDNPRVGSDSWTFGAVSSADLEGRVLARIWPRPRGFRR